jgi:CBS domain-containing protein
MMTQRTIRHILEVKGFDVWSVGPDTFVFDALRMMGDKDVGALLVMEQDVMVGIVSERDYARKVVLLGKTSRGTTVRDIMSSKVISIHPDQTVEEAMEVMNNNRIRHLPVVEGQKVIGVIAQRDVMRAIIHKQREALRALENKIQH